MGFFWNWRNPKLNIAMYHLNLSQIVMIWGNQASYCVQNFILCHSLVPLLPLSVPLCVCDWWIWLSALLFRLVGGSGSTKGNLDDDTKLTESGGTAGKVRSYRLMMIECRHPSTNPTHHLHIPLPRTAAAYLLIISDSKCDEISYLSFNSLLKPSLRKLCRSLGDDLPASMLLAHHPSTSCLFYMTFLKTPFELLLPAHITLFLSVLLLPPCLSTALFCAYDHAAYSIHPFKYCTTSKRTDPNYEFGRYGK